jgi:peroxiredoxin
MSDNDQIHPNAGLALGPGQMAVDFTLPNTDGSFYTLTTALTAGPLILVFYRGDW